MNDQEKLADEVQTALLRTRLELTNIVRAAAYESLKAIGDGGDTGQLAELAYAFACLEGAHRGGLPGSPPSPRNGASAEIPRKQPTSSPQHGLSYAPGGDTSRTNR